MKPTSALLGLVLALGLLGQLTSAAPFYYYFADEAAPSPAETQAPASVQEAANLARDSIKDGAQQVSDKVAPGGGEAPIRERISGHMSDLYSHGSSAMKGLVDTVQPDIKNIGKDLSEAYQQTRETVGKRIEPIAQTVRPYIDQAQKAVAPYMSKAREEVPKAMSNVWSKISGGQNQGAIQEAGDQIQHGANSVQKDANGAAPANQQQQ